MSLRPKALLAWLCTGVARRGPTTPGDLEAFRAHSAVQGRRDSARFALLMLVFNLAFWATDPWVFRSMQGVQRVFFDMRIAISALASAALLLFWLWPRSFRVVAAAGWTLGCLVVARGLGKLGGPGTLWFHFLYPFLLAPLVLYMIPLERLLATPLLGGLVLVGFFVERPASLADPLAPSALGFFSFVCALSLLVGWAIDTSRLSFFFLRRELERERACLASRVEEKTRALRQLALHLDRVQDAERTRLARELHDESGQSLAAMRYVLRASLARFERDPRAIKPNLDQLASLLDELSEQLRDVVSELRPRVLDELGLEAAIEWMVAQTQQRTGLRCRLDLPGAPLALPPDVATAAFRSVQEALTNVAKHASASQVTISLGVQGEGLVLRVVDDGVGLVASPGSSGLGLLGMRERAESLGGSVSISAAPGAGTSVEIRFSLR